MINLKNKNILAPLAGTMLEYYDFALYAAFSPIISDYFFDSKSKSTTLLVYALSFLMRPIGALVFGFIGDRYGRRKAFALPLVFMAIFTLSMTLIPSYREIGVASSFLLILCRLGQGFCLGAEFGGALVFSLEHSKNNKGITAGLLGSSVLLGSLLANLISFFITLPMFPSNYWRIPFIIGSLIGIIGIWIRYNLQESPQFIISKAPKVPIAIILKNYPLSLVKASSIAGLSGLMGSFIFVYINFFLVNNLHWSLNKSLCLTSYAHLISLFSSPAAGLLSQKYSSYRVVIFSCILLILVLIPCSYLIVNSSLFLVIFSISVLSLLTGMCWGSANLAIYSLFPAEVRYTGVAVSDSLGKIIFSAPIPFLCSYNETSTGYPSALIPVLFIAIILLLQCVVQFSNDRNYHRIHHFE